MVVITIGAVRDGAGTALRYGSSFLNYAALVPQPHLFQKLISPKHCLTDYAALAPNL
jgi:hypothetical protein